MPEMPFEVAGNDGAIIGEILAGWPDAKVGISSADQTNDVGILRERGWLVFDGDDALTLESVKSALQERLG